MTSTGEVLSHFRDDVYFSIPDFIDDFLISRCSTSEEAEDEHQIAARVRVLKEIRYLEKSIEAKFNKLASLMQNAYEALKPQDPDEWGHVTTSEAAAKLLSPAKGPFSTATIIAVHKHLLRKSDEFVANQTQFLSNQLFWIRPQSHIKDLKAVTDLVNRRDPVVDAFAIKASALIQRNRETIRQSASGRPSIQPVPDVEWTPQETTIVRFLKASLRSYRSVQKDSYLVPLAFLIKKVAYNVRDNDNALIDFDDGIDDNVLAQFLVEIGVMSTWEDPSTSKTELQFLEEKGTERQLSSIAIQADPSIQSYTPTDLYVQDPAESIRHDFGDLPVYVVDDIDAQELDDGMSIEPIHGDPGSFWLHVHIADPTSILPPTHEIAHRAHQHITTRYFIDRTEPMLPHTSTFLNLSLGSGRVEGQPDKTITFSFRTGPNGDILDYKVRAGLVRNVHVVQYDEVNAALGLPVNSIYTFPFGGGVSPPLFRTFPEGQLQDFRNLRQVAQYLVDARLRGESMVANDPKAELRISQKPLPSNPYDLSRPIQSIGFPDMTYAVLDDNVDVPDARVIVSEMMKAACRIASRFFLDRNIPAIRRSAERMIIPSEEVMADLLAQRNSMGNVPFSALGKVNALYPAAQYTTKPLGHWQLGVPDDEGYSRVSSPLRRYTDLLAHWQIKHALLSPGTRPLFSEEYLNSFIVEMRAKEHRLKRTTINHNMNWAIKFLQRWQQFPDTHKDMEDPLSNLEAIVVSEPIEDITNRLYHARVALPSLGLRATLKVLETKAEARAGAIIPVRISELKTGLTPRITVLRR